MREAVHSLATVKLPVSTPQAAFSEVPMLKVKFNDKSALLA